MAKTYWNTKTGEKYEQQNDGSWLVYSPSIHNTKDVTKSSYIGSGRPLKNTVYLNVNGKTVSVGPGAAAGANIGASVGSAFFNGKGKKAATNKKANAVNNKARKPAAASAPRSNFSTPTPTYYTSLDSGITGYKLDPDQKKYLESLGVKSVKELQERLNTDLKSGLVVDDKWGKRTQDAFTAGYNAWKNQQQERPQQQQFDYNQLFNQWNQWMNQQPRQQGITAMPATYDRYDINHWLRTNGIKGITSKGKKALRLAANGEAYDTRYQGIVDQYLPMLRGNQGNAQSTPTMDPRYVEYFQNLTGTSYNAPKASTTNVDDMYAPGYFRKVYDWAQNNPDAFQQAKQNMIGRGVANFATTAMNGAANLFNALNTFKQNNPQQPSISTPSYRSTDTHTNPMQSNKLFQKVSDWANQNLNLKDYSSNNQALFAKEGGYIPKFQNPAYPIQRRKINFAKGGDNSMNWMVRTVQEELWKAGAFKGIKNRRGKAITHDEAVDGLMGPMTRRAINNAKNAGMAVSNVMNTTARGISQMMPLKSNKPKNQSKANSDKSALEYAYAPGTTPSVVNQLMQEVGSRIGSGDKEIPEEQQEGHAIYLHYPNFTGNSANALKIGDLDVGAAIGNPSIPVGHDAFVLVGPDGTANYYEYGRYNSGPIIGHKRPTVKGGNWRHIPLPAQNPEENDSVYISRVQSMLPDTKTGAYQAMTIPHVDTEKATQYVYDQANDPNRKEYSIDNTCATGACKATLPFRTIKESHPLQGMFNWGGYSLPAAVWSLIPGSTDSYATTAREAASNVYVMNDKSDKKK